MDKVIIAKQFFCLNWGFDISAIFFILLYTTIDILNHLKIDDYIAFLSGFYTNHI